MNFKPAQLNSNSCHKWKSSKNVDSFVYLGSEISSTDKDIKIRIAKAWAAYESYMEINAAQKPKA